MSRSPDLVNEAGTIRAWALSASPGVGPKDWDAGIRTWFVEANLGILDPIFSAWFVGVVSLRDIEGVPPAKRHYPEAAYELLCFTVDPDKGVTVDTYDERASTGDLDGGPSGILVQPADIVYQWHGTDDAGALSIGEAFIRAVVIGGMSPSRPPSGLGGDVLFRPEAARAFDAEWRRRLDATVEHFSTGHWPAPKGRVS